MVTIVVIIAAVVVIVLIVGASLFIRSRRGTQGVAAAPIRITRNPNE